MVIEKERFFPTTGGLGKFVMRFICLPNNEGWYKHWNNTGPHIHSTATQKIRTVCTVWSR